MASGVKFISAVSPHLICSLCNCVFDDPVINTSCGHTFCRKCTQSQNITCNQDQLAISRDNVITNRAVQAQIDELEVYCSHALVYSEEVQDFVVDSTSCPAVLKYAERETHEVSCQFAMVPCPFNQEKCGKMRRKDLEKHIKHCRNIKCPNTGCSFLGNNTEIGAHLKSCGKFQADRPNEHNMSRPSVEMEQLVRQLLNRVTQLEMSKNGLEKQLIDCRRSITILEESNKVLTVSVDKLSSTFQNPGERTPRRQLSFTALLTPSSKSPPGTQSLSSDLWTMPMQFKCIGTLRGHVGAVWGLTRRGHTLYSCGEDRLIKVWDLERITAGCQQTIKGSKEKLHRLAVSERYLHAGSAKGTISAWDLQTYKLIKQVKVPGKDSGSTVKYPSGHKIGDISAMVISGQYLFTTSGSTVMVWTADNLELVHSMAGMEHCVSSLALNSTKDRLYSGSHNTIDVWATSPPFALKGKVSHSYGYVHSLLVTDKFIFAGTHEQNIHVFDAVSLEHMQQLLGHMGSVNALVCNPAGNFMFSASSDCTIQIWHLDEQLMLRTQVLERHQSSVTSLTLYKDLLLSASEDNEIKVFRYFKM